VDAKVKTIARACSQNSATDNAGNQQTVTRAVTR
jgi:hypothetical protein